MTDTPKKCGTCAFYAPMNWGIAKPDLWKGSCQITLPAALEALLREYREAFTIANSCCDLWKSK